MLDPEKGLYQKPNRNMGSRGVGWATLLFWVALGLRLLSSFATVAPDRDTAWYVHMAQGARRGGDSWLNAVFPPLHPFLLSLLGPFPGSFPEDWWFSAQILCSVQGALAVALLFWALSREMGPYLALFAALTLGLGFVSCGTAADGLTEPLFQLLLVLGLCACLSNLNAWFLPSLAFGLLPIVRPEGLALLPWAWWRSWRRSPIFLIPSLVFTLGPRIGYLVLRYQVSGDASLFPKGDFMWHLSAFSEGGVIQGLQHWGREAGSFLFQGFEGVGLLAWPLFFLGVVWIWRERQGAARGLFLPCSLLCFALLAVPVYHANRRFFAPWVPLILVLALAPFAQWRKRNQAILLILGALFMVPGTIRLLGPRRSALAPDKALGFALRKGLPKEAEIASDLPRFLFFSGRPPLPPRHISAQELMALAARKKNAAVVSLERRGKIHPTFLQSLGYVAVPLSRLLGPEGLEKKRGLQLFMRETVMVK